jgi:hypothetical protein
VLTAPRLLFPLDCRCRCLQVVGQADLEDGESLFQWLMSPVDVETFYDAIHEDEPLLVTRPNNRAYFEGLFSKTGEWMDVLCTLGCRGGPVQHGR